MRLWVVFLTLFLSPNLFACEKHDQLKTSQSVSREMAQHTGVQNSEQKEKVMKMYESYQEDFSNIEHISVSELRKLKSQMSQNKKDRDQKSWILVDARSKEERAVSKIPGSLSAEEFEASLSDYQDKKVIAYCTIGYRSGQFVEKMREKGLQAFNLKGSLLGWIHEGGEVVDPDGKSIKKVHVYGPTWNIVPKGWESTW